MRTSSNPYGIKKGDIIVPLPGRRTSNGYSLSRMFDAKVKSMIPYVSSGNKQQMAVSIRRNDKDSYNGTYTVFADAFKPRNVEDEYEIF
jgi:hypothetical protein